MKKQWIMAIVLLLCLFVLAACQTEEKPRFTVRTDVDPSAQIQQGLQIQQPQQTLPEDIVSEGYDPRVEEDGYDADLDYWQGEIATPVPVTPTPAPTVRGEFAGATPVPLDPIDKPTPTAVPPLAAFTYTTYDATNLGLSFEGPAGWLKDSSVEGAFTIQNPNRSVPYPATLTLYAQQVKRNYSDSELQAEVRSMLASLEGDPELSDFDTKTAAKRDLLGASGWYNNYSGEKNGIRIAGRVHVVCVEKVLYRVHITYPEVYEEQYKDQVYDKLRRTIVITK